MTFEQIEANLRYNHSIRLTDGGKSFTQLNSHCDSTHVPFTRVAIIIPYRDRLDNLKIFLNNMHRYLTRQKINYGIYVIEPVRNITFNRGLLMNIGFVESIKDMLVNNNNRTSGKSYWDCFIFHDVDMIPEDERVSYTCNQSFPVHLAVARSKNNYS